MEEEDYKLQDVGSLAKKIPSEEWSFWKKIIIFSIIGFVVIIAIIVIIILMSKSSSSSNSNEGINESKVTADLICQFDIDQTSQKTQILGKEFIKPNSFDILVDDQKIGFFKEYQFSNSGQHKLRFVFYDNSINLDNMFNGVKSLLN